MLFRSVLGSEGGPHGTDLHAGGILTLIAEFRNKETPYDVRVLRPTPGLSLLRLNTLNGNITILLYNVSFHPGAAKERLFRNVVFCLACLDTQAAPYTLVDIDAHAVEMLLGIIFAVPRFCMGIPERAPEQSGSGNKQDGVFQELSSIHDPCHILSGRCG